VRYSLLYSFYSTLFTLLFLLYSFYSTLFTLLFLLYSFAFSRLASVLTRLL
jgi:hypothetical protein